MEYTLNLSDEQVKYYENLDCQSLVDDMEQMVELLDSLDYEDVEYV